MSSYVEASHPSLERIVRDAHRVAVNADGAPEASASARAQAGASLMGIVLNETPSEEEAGAPRCRA